MNSVCISGRLARDVELRYTQSGKAVANFTVAVEDRFRKDNDGKNYAYFIDVKVWDKTAEFVSKNTSKGLRIEVFGKLEQDRWEDNNGNKRSKIVINANNIEIIDWADNQQSENIPGKEVEISEDDIPF